MHLNFIVNYYAETQSEFSDSPIEPSQGEEVIAALEKNGINFIGTGGGGRGKTSKKGNKAKMGSVRIDIPATTPTRTIAAVTSMLWEDLVNSPKKESPGEFLNRKKIQCAEKMIRGAFVELYRGLGLLKRYRLIHFAHMLLYLIAFFFFFFLVNRYGYFIKLNNKKTSKFRNMAACHSTCFMNIFLKNY